MSLTAGLARLRPTLKATGVAGVYRLSPGPRSPERFLVIGVDNGVEFYVGVFRNWSVALAEGTRSRNIKAGKGCVQRVGRNLTRPYRAFLPGGKPLGFFLRESEGWRAIAECIANPDAILKYRHTHRGPSRDPRLCPACSPRVMGRRRGRGGKDALTAP